jgi:hypothetical protein
MARLRKCNSTHRECWSSRSKRILLRSIASSS